MAGGNSSSRTVALAACAAIVVGSIGPWVSTPIIDKAGTDGDGLVTLLLAVIGGLVILRSPKSRWLLIPAIFGILIAGVAVYDLIEVMSNSEAELFGEPVDIIDPGWGLWLTTIASVPFLIASYWHYREAREDDEAESEPAQ